MLRVLGLKTGQWRQRSLSLNFSAALFAISVVPLLGFYWASSSLAERSIVDMASQQNFQMLRNERDFLTWHMEQLETIAVHVADAQEASDIIEDLQSDTTSFGGVEVALKSKLDQTLAGFPSLAGVVSVDLVSREGIHHRVGSGKTFSVELPQQRAGQIMETLHGSQKVAWLGIEDSIDPRAPKAKVLSVAKMVARPVAGEGSLRALGAVVVNVSSAYLVDRFRTVAMVGKGEMMLVDGDGRLIYHPDSKRIGTSVDSQIRDLLDGPSGSAMERIGGKQVLLSYDSIPDKGWYAISTASRDDLLAPLGNIRGVAVVLLAAMVIAVMWLVVVFSARVVRPVGQISDAFSKFRTGDLEPGWRMSRPKTIRPILLLVDWFNAFLESRERLEFDETRLRIAAIAFESQEGMLVLDPTAKVVQANSAVEKITGYSPAEVIGQSMDVMYSERLGEQLVPRLRKLIGSAGSWQGELSNRRKNGEEYTAYGTITVVKDDAGKVTHYVATFTDITDRKSSEEEIRKLAFFDPLTGLPNRRLLSDRLQHAMVEAPRRKQAMALMFMDLDKFKSLNDTLGHQAGDVLLKQVGKRLRNAVREGDTVARLGGDEFVILLEGLSESKTTAYLQAEQVGQKILGSMAEAFHNLGGSSYHSTLSIGIAVYAEPGATPDELMRQADIALYQAKEAGRNALRFFDPMMQKTVMDRAALEQSVRSGIDEDQFQIFLQPKVDDDRMIVGAEALVRWIHPVRGMVPPQDFIPFAEDSGLIVQLGRVVLRKACEQLVAWSKHEHSKDLNIAVNVSPREFRQTDFVEQVMQVISRSGASPSKITLEITESLFVDDMSDVVEKMTALRDRGISFAIDDFGTGYSSLSYLKRMPLQELKIDRSFVRDVLTDASDATIARAVIALAGELGIGVVAEGIESEEQRGFLSRNGCKSFQGFLFSAPVPGEKFDSLLMRQLEASKV